MASEMDEKPGVGRSKSYSSAPSGKEFMVAMESAVSISIPDDTLTAVFHKSTGKNEALDLPSDLLMEHDFVPRNASETCMRFRE